MDSEDKRVKQNMPKDSDHKYDHNYGQKINVNEDDIECCNDTCCI